MASESSMGEGQVPERRINGSILALCFYAATKGFHCLGGMSVSVGIGDRKERHVA